MSELYLVEPMAELHDELRQSIAHTPDLRGKTHIVPCGVEQQDELLKHGVSLESFDTIVLGMPVIPHADSDIYVFL